MLSVGRQLTRRGPLRAVATTKDERPGRATLCPAKRVTAHRATGAKRVDEGKRVLTRQGNQTSRLTRAGRRDCLASSRPTRPADSWPTSRPIRGAPRWPRTLLLVAALSLPLLTGGCGVDLPDLSSIPVDNPFSEAPTSVAAAPTATPTTAPVPTASAPAVAAAEPTPTPAFTPFWVKNHRLAEMWSGQVDAPGVVSFGTTSQQFCSFRVMLPQQEQRLYVFNPYSQNYFWIDADEVGPVGPPERLPGPPPPGQNCAAAVYEG